MLPIHDVRNQITAALRQSNRLVLAAPTGSGKTTQTPQFIHHDLKPAGRIIVLQPRRIAARMMAKRVAQEMNSPLGKLVGYQTRHDSNISDENAIRFMTEGLLLRLLQSNPTLSDVSVVMLDEFHERNLAGDAALAMLKHLQETSRADLKIVVMSATLDVQQVAGYLNCDAVEAGGRAYPVDIRYQAKAAQVRTSQPAFTPIWEQAASALSSLLTAEPEGDVLIFMPGVYEIRRTIEACDRRIDTARVGELAMLPLYSELPMAQQEEAVSPARKGVRKVIVSTNVAETSLTIEGVRHVIDSGVARISRFDPRRGVNTLWVEPISQASAMQRAGRAGRTAPGTCYRLWSEFENKGRDAQSTPEIRRVDLAEALLWLASLGSADVRGFDWLEPPSMESMEQALAVLKMLGAIQTQTESNVTLTAAGRLMAQLPVHPRWGRMLVEAAARGCLARATTWAAIASERDLMQRQPAGRDRKIATSDDAIHSDLELIESVFEQACVARFDFGRCASMGVNASAARQVDATRRQLQQSAERAGLREAKASSSSSSSLRNRSQDNVDDLIRCLLVAFPDHVAVRRGEGRLCAMSGGQRKACELSPETAVDAQGLFLAIDIRETGAGGGVKTVLSVISHIHPDWLRELYPERVVDEKIVAWNRVKLVVEEVEQSRFDDLVFTQINRPTPDPAQSTALLASLVAQGELKLNQWDEEVTQWIARTRSVATWFSDRGLLTYDADDLEVIYQEICDGASRYTQIADRPCLEIVKSALDWNDVQFVEQMAPARITLTGGMRMPVTYQEQGQPPRGRGKIQDFYDMTTTPSVAGGRVKILLEILGPNYRPVQVTQDLPGFWVNLYPQLMKELKRKYPRQIWRETPVS